MNDGPFLLIEGDRQTALDDVASLLVRDGQLRLVDVFGKQRDLAGSIQEIDLLNRRIVLA
ncbi:MAG: CooT family nickel-binding protein [Desulfuromonadales bacterium]|nr:CooT family nickel-binding protein [Desulfuromonadales bacterium]